MCRTELDEGGRRGEKEASGDNDEQTVVSVCVCNCSYMHLERLFSPSEETGGGNQVPDCNTAYTLTLIRCQAERQPSSLTASPCERRIARKETREAKIEGRKVEKREEKERKKNTQSAVLFHFSLAPE